MKTISADDKFASEWQKLISEAKETKKELAPNEKTRSEFCKETGMTIEEADTFVDNLIKLGKAETFLKVVDGHKHKVIRLIQF